MSCQEEGTTVNFDHVEKLAHLAKSSRKTENPGLCKIYTFYNVVLNLNLKR